MKNLFLLLFFTLSVSAMANTTETKTAKKAEKLTFPVNESYTATQADFETDDTKKKNKSVETAPDSSRYGLSYYLVDFINRNNLKIVKCFLKD